MKKEISMGRHLILEVYDVSFDLLNDCQKITEILRNGIERSKMNILNVFSHEFSPHGVTIIFALEESHVSVHTFPEMNSLSADAYTCGSGNPKIIMNVLLQYCDSNSYQLRELYR